MKSRLSIVISLIVLASMLISACTPATVTQPPAPAATEAPTATTAAQQATEAPTATTAPNQPTATTAPVQPTATAAAAVPTATAAAPKTTRTGGWLDKIIFSAIADPQPAVAQLQAGTIDIYGATNQDPTVFETVKNDKNLGYAMTYGSNDQMIFNTTACADKTKLNPFTDQKIREAMNWAIDRNYIAQEIVGGLAIPKYTALTGAFPDAARNAATLAAIQTKYGYNMDKAKAVVEEEMPKLGATKGADGKWAFNGQPVTIIGLIRTEDSRKEMGIYFAKQLETLGFTVDQQLKTRKEAAPIWQGADVDQCKFTYYTAGWINTAIARDEGIVFQEFNTGKVQNIPVFNNYKPSDKLNEVGDKLLTNNFKTMDERLGYFTDALNLSMEESWWGLWLVDLTSFTPYRSGVESAFDLAAGVGNSLEPYTLRFTGKEGGEMHFANSAVLVQAWNPINGSNWIDDAVVQRTTEDFGLVPNPYTGLSLPKLVQKGEVIAKTGLPITKTLDWVDLKFQDTIKVPDDAWADWDAKAQKFITAKDRAAADAADTNKKDTEKYKQEANVQETVTYIPDLYKTKWHDGSNMSVADFVMTMIMTFDQAKKDSPIYDETTVPTVETFLTHFKGVKIMSTDPLVITTWDDTYALDAENSISTWYPSSGYAYGTAAWHNLTPAIQAEADKKMAFSTDKGAALNPKVDQTSLIAGPTLDIQSTYLDQDATSGYIPYEPTLGQYIKPDEAKARYANLQAFYKAHKNLWLGTGPYFIDQVFSVEGTITVSRFADYMFPADQFAGFGGAEIATVTVDGPTSVKAGDAATFNVTINFGDKPYPTKDIDNVAWTLFDAGGNVIGSGQAKNTADGQWTVDVPTDVTSKLTEGSSKLSVAVSSKTVSLPAFATYEFVATK